MTKKMTCPEPMFPGEIEKLEKEINDMGDTLPETGNPFIFAIKKAKVPTREENRELVIRAKAGDKDAMGEIMVRNGKLVMAVMKKYAYLNYGEFDDLVQEGMLGIRAAVEKFDPEAGTAFSTYAVFWIRQSITRYLDNNGRNIRLPVHVNEKVWQYKKAVRELGEADVHNPNDKQIMEASGMTEEQLKLVKANAAGTVSLNILIGEEEESELGDFIEDKNVDVEEEVISSIMSEEIIRAIQQVLTEKEFDIISRRFGFDGKQPETLETIGETYGVTRERIRQIEQKALRKLKYRRVFAGMR